MQWMRADGAPGDGQFVPQPGALRVAIRLVACFAIVGLAFGAFLLVRQRGMGTVHIRTRPAGATVVFDGLQTTSLFPEEFSDTEALWSAPLVLHRHPGTYEVTVSAPGYTPRTTRVVVLARRTASLEVDLDAPADAPAAIVGVPIPHLVHFPLDGLHRERHGVADHPPEETSARSIAVPAEPLPVGRMVIPRPVRPAPIPVRPPISVRPLIPVRPIIIP